MEVCQAKKWMRRCALGLFISGCGMALGYALFPVLVMMVMVYLLVGVISWAEKTVYRCEDFPNDREQVLDELRLEVLQKPFEAIEGCDSILHGVRSW